MSGKFKPVKNFEDYYLVDSDGNFLSYRARGRECKTTDRSNYPRPLNHYITKTVGCPSRLVAIGGTTKTVAELLMTTFGPEKPTENAEVSFLDGNSLNIKLSNLVWRERSESQRICQNRPGTVQKKSEALKKAHADGCFKEAGAKRSATFARKRLEKQNASS